MTKPIQSPDIDVLSSKIGLKVVGIECLDSMPTKGDGYHRSLGYRLAFSDSSVLTLSLEDFEYEEGGEVYLIRTSDRFIEGSRWAVVDDIPSVISDSPIAFWEVITGCSQLFNDLGVPISPMYVVEEGVRFIYKGGSKLEFRPSSVSPSEALTMNWSMPS